MKILIDSADINVINKLYTIYHFDGVTTNPKLLSRIEGKPYEILGQIRKEIPKEAQLHVQVVSSEKQYMLREADYILKTLGADTHIKIPVCTDGYSVIERLSQDGIKVTATAIFNHAQALMAAHQGAYLVAPYIHRINNKGYDGVQTALQIQKLLSLHQCKTQLLAAAFENVAQIMEVLASGAESVTVTPELLMEVFSNSLTEDAVVDFRKDFSDQFKQNTMLG